MPSDDDDANARLDESIEIMQARVRAGQQARLADAIAGVPDLERLLASGRLHTIAAVGVQDSSDIPTVAALAAAVHNDVVWDALVQRRAIIEALRRA